ncbi:hypothetical protein I3700191H1_14420 [Megasphaera massiliensis]|uniref:hypothetical protein n=1 Tax=Megasphaera massiliensis TaxID=1232428 RepID=UPI0034A90979
MFKNKEVFHERLCFDRVKTKMYNNYSECGANAGSTRQTEPTNDMIQGSKREETRTTRQ